MASLKKLLDAANKSPLNRWIVNRILWHKIPFNKPHQPTIRAIHANGATIGLAFKKQNKNHLNSIHACALITLAEYTSGLVLLAALGPESYRLIMKSIDAVFHYQAKTDVISHFELSDQEIQQIKTSLTHQEAILLPLSIPIYDQANQIVCTVNVNWQLKNWQAVKTII